MVFDLVEARGIEPLSEREPTKTSPSAVYALNFAPLPVTDHLLSRYLDQFPQSASENWHLSIPLI